VIPKSNFGVGAIRTLEEGLDSSSASNEQKQLYDDRQRQLHIVNPGKTQQLAEFASIQIVS